MITIKQIVSLVFSIGAFAITFYSVSKLMLFLSSPVQTSKIEALKISQLLDSEILLKNVLLSLIIDMILIILFILQHSLMKSELIKRFWIVLGLGVAERSIYNMASSFSLLVFIIY